jgi:hypothetical protein
MVLSPLARLMYEENMSGWVGLDRYIMRDLGSEGRKAKGGKLSRGSLWHLNNRNKH